MRNVERAGVRIERFEAFEQPVHVRAGVLRLVEEPLHVRLPDAFEVVADAQVEDDAGRLAGKTKSAVQRVNQHPGARVLLERFVNFQFLGPLDVVALVLHVDAGLRDVELVQRLHGLELDIARPAQPGGDDVLRHLRVRACGRAERGGDAPAEYGRGKPLVGAGNKEVAARNPEHGVTGFELPKDPRKQLFRGYWPE